MLKLRKPFFESAHEFTVPRAFYLFFSDVPPIIQRTMSPVDKSVAFVFPRLLVRLFRLRGTFTAIIMHNIILRKITDFTQPGPR
jgi:hypothetical protein